VWKVRRRLREAPRPRPSPADLADHGAGQEPELGPLANLGTRREHVESTPLDPVEDRQPAAREQVHVDGQRT
jgi:hypothetical protein